MLYLVRWPNLTAAIVEADDEDHLTLRLDELADPSCASWEPYEGHPIWFEIESPVRVRRVDENRRAASVDELVLEGLGDVDPGGDFFSGAHGDSEMLHDILAATFPAIEEVLSAAAVLDEGFDEEQFIADLDAACREELGALVRHGGAPHDPEAQARAFELVRLATESRPAWQPKREGDVTVAELVTLSRALADAQRDGVRMVLPEAALERLVNHHIEAAQEWASASQLARTLRAERDLERERARAMHAALIAIATSKARRLAALRTLAAHAIADDDAIMLGVSAETGLPVNELVRARARRVIDSLREAVRKGRPDDEPEPG